MMGPSPTKTRGSIDNTTVPASTGSSLAKSLPASAHPADPTAGHPILSTPSSRPMPAQLRLGSKSDIPVPCASPFVLSPRPIAVPQSPAVLNFLASPTLVAASARKPVRNNAVQPLDVYATPRKASSHKQQAQADFSTLPPPPMPSLTHGGTDKQSAATNGSSPAKRRPAPFGARAASPVKQQPLRAASPVKSSRTAPAPQPRLAAPSATPSRSSSQLSQYEGAQYAQRRTPSASARTSGIPRYQQATAASLARSTPASSASGHLYSADVIPPLAPMSRNSQRSFDTIHQCHSQPQSVFRPRQVRVPDAPPAVPTYQTVEELLQSFGPQQPHQLHDYQPFTGEQEQNARAAHHAFQDQHHLTWVSQAPVSSSSAQGSLTVAPSLFRTQSHQPGSSGAGSSSNLEVASAPMQRAYSSPANPVAAQPATAAAATTTVSLGDGIIVAGRHYPVSNAADLLAGLVANSNSTSTNATPAPSTSTSATPAPTHASGRSRTNEELVHHQMQLQPTKQVLAYEVRPEDLVQYVMMDPATGMIVDWDAGAHGAYPSADVYADAAGGHAGESGYGHSQQQQGHERSKKEHIPSFGSWIHASPLPTPDSADTNPTLGEGPDSASRPQFTYLHQQHLVPIRSTSDEHAQVQNMQMDGMLSATSMVNWPPTAAGNAYPHGQQRHLPDTPTMYITETEHGQQAEQLDRERDEQEGSVEAANLTIIEHVIDEDDGEQYEDGSYEHEQGQDGRHGGNTSMQSIGSIKSGDGISQYLHC